MCTSSVKSYTNSRYISKLRPQGFLTSFPCGMCADCIRKARSQWSLRAYYEAKRLFDTNKDGFVLFDTLTYSDGNLRTFHDVLGIEDVDCDGVSNWINPNLIAFSRPDVQKFFKRLRIALTRDGFDIKDKLRYFLTSEYGTSEEYHGRRCTHRPHYHVLFYVSFHIDPVDFSRYVSQAWTFGKTDGVRPYDSCDDCPVKSYCPSYYNHSRWCMYKSDRYVLDERVIRNSPGQSLKLIRYVSKYVSKDLYTYRTLFGRVYDWFSVWRPNWQDSYAGKMAFLKVRRNVLPFHLQSLGFGDYALNVEDPKYIDRYGAIRMPVARDVVASIPISQFFKRRLYFNHLIIDGRVVWRPNRKYFDNKIKSFNRSVISLRNRLFSFRSSLGLSRCEEIARYSLLYRGRLCSKQDLLLSDKDFFLRSITSPNLAMEVPNGFCWCNYNHRKYSDDIGFTYNPDTKSYFRHGYYNRGRHITDGVRSWSHSEFMISPPDGYLVVTSQSVPRFAGMDSLLNDYDDYIQKNGAAANVLMAQSESQHDRYVSLGFLDK